MGLYGKINAEINAEVIAYQGKFRFDGETIMKRQISFLLVIILSLSILSGCNMNDGKKAEQFPNGQEPTGTGQKDTKSNTVDIDIQEDSELQKALKITYPLDELQSDFQQFQEYIEMNHPMLFTDKEELAELFHTQYQKLEDDMGELEFYRNLMPITAKMNCVHTNLSLSKKLKNLINNHGKVLPLNIKVIDKKAYVYDSFHSCDIPKGSRLLSINGRPIEEIINVFFNNISADGLNETKKYLEMNYFFSDLYYMIIENPDEFTVTYLSADDGKTYSINIYAAKKVQSANESGMINGQEETGSLFYQEFQEDYAVLTIKSFDFYDDKNRDRFYEFLDDFFDKLDKRKISNLILDLRDNGGGDPYCSSYLFSYLIDEEKPYFNKNVTGYIDLTDPIKPKEKNFTGDLYTLINGFCVSSTGHLCALLKYHEIGSFYGEESGGSYICSANTKDVVLSHTNIILYCATVQAEVAVSGLTQGRGIIPEHIIMPTIQDYLDNKDVVMNYVLENMKK